MSPPGNAEGPRTYYSQEGEMRDRKRGGPIRAEEVGAVPSEELPTGEGTDTLEIERPPVRITFPGDALSVRAGSRRRWPRESAAAPPAPPDSSADLRSGERPGLHL